MENIRQPRSTVSFHLSSSEKDRLVDAAQDSFGSITDYIKFKLFYNSDQKDLIQAQTKLKELEEQMELISSSSFFENPSFQAMYSKVKGKELSYKRNNGEMGKTLIDSEEKLGLLMIKCFEIWS